MHTDCCLLSYAEYCIVQSGVTEKQDLQSIGL